MNRDKQINNIDLLMRIKEVKLPVGAKYLSEKLCIPQASIGRMLTQLEKEGLLEKVSNKGRQLTDKGIEYLEKKKIMNSKQKTVDKLINLVEDNISKEQLLEVLDVRKLLEGRSIELVCENATDAEIAELDNIVLESVYEIKHGRLASEQDLNLHLSIAKMSKNETIYQILKIILTKNNAYTKFSIVADSLKKAQLKQHSDIVEAIKSRDCVHAKIAMEEHLNQVISDVKMYYV